MKLTDISVIRALMGEEQTTFKKKFGQNFLINENVVEKIATGCGEDARAGILEIGPGIGVLTCELAKRFDKVVTVEIDDTMIPILEKTLAEFDNISVIHSDILKVDLVSVMKEHFSDVSEVRVCANLPYYITTPILMHLLESGIPFKSITVMVQKEVADRLCAPAGSPLYGAVTASVSYYGKATRLFVVSAGNFMPAPKVDSAVVRIDLYEKPPVDCNFKTIMRVIRGAFLQRRKTLVNALASEFSHVSKENISKAIVNSGFSADIRGEKLSLSDFAKVANALDELK